MYRLRMDAALTLQAAIEICRKRLGTVLFLHLHHGPVICCLLRQLLRAFDGKAR